jgi:hypothetical protein
MPINKDFANHTCPNTVRIASGQTVSTAVDLVGTTLTGVRLPATMTSTSYTFQVSEDGINYAVLDDGNGTSYTRTCAQGRAFSVDPAMFYGWPFVKIVSSGAEGADRDIVLVSNPI